MEAEWSVKRKEGIGPEGSRRRCTRHGVECSIIHFSGRLNEDSARYEAEAGALKQWPLDMHEIAFACEAPSIQAEVT